MRFHLRFASLKILLKQRRLNLQESLRLHHFLYDVTEEEAWISEKKKLMSGEDVGKDLRGVKKMQKKHKRLDNKIEIRSGKISRVLVN